MYNYILEENNKIIIMEEDTQVGKLTVSAKDKKALVEIEEMPKISKNDFENYFMLMKEMSNNIKRLLNVDDVVWENMAEIKQFNYEIENLLKQQPKLNRK